MLCNLTQQSKKEKSELLLIYYYGFAEGSVATYSRTHQGKTINENLMWCLENTLDIQIASVNISVL